jgi:hypothetical protein
MNTYGRVEVRLHIFLTLALYGGECQLHAPAPGHNRTGTGWTAITGLDAVAKRDTPALDGNITLVVPPVVEFKYENCFNLEFCAFIYCTRVYPKVSGLSR